VKFVTEPWSCCAGAWDQADGRVRMRLTVAPEKRNQSLVIETIAKALYEKEEDVLKNCAFCQFHEEFVDAVQMLSNNYDFRGLLGGCSRYTNFSEILRALDLPFAHKFPKERVLGGGGPTANGVDPALQLAQIQADNYALALNAVDAILWFAMMRRPRRDFGMLQDTAHTITSLLFKLLPRSVFPYSMVPMGRLDPFTMTQVLLDLEENSLSTQDHRPQNIVRFHDASYMDKHFAIECPGFGKTGILEEEAFMETIMVVSSKLKVHWNDVPLTMWATRLALEPDRCYPFIRYVNCNEFEQEGAVMPHHARARDCTDIFHGGLWL